MPLSTENINAEISPNDFELLVKDYITECGKNLQSFSAIHNVNIARSDGEYQIDIFAEFDFLGVNFKVIVECKRHKNKIKREVVQLLYDKLRAIGAQKGIIFSTSGFQDGATLFAEEHGIALIRVIEGKYTYHTKSYDTVYLEPPEWLDIPKYVGEYINGNRIYYLQKGHTEALDEFLFEN